MIYMSSYVPGAAEAAAALDPVERVPRICSTCARCTEVGSMWICCQVYSNKNADFDVWQVEPNEEACDYYTTDRREWAS